MLLLITVLCTGLSHETHARKVRDDYCRVVTVSIEGSVLDAQWRREQEARDERGRGRNRARALSCEAAKLDKAGSVAIFSGRSRTVTSITEAIINGAARVHMSLVEKDERETVFAEWQGAENA
jgi:hypothetical protein